MIYLWGAGLAPQVGFEPTTLRLTAGCSAIELLRNTGARRRSATAPQRGRCDETVVYCARMDRSTARTGMIATSADPPADRFDTPAATAARRRARARYHASAAAFQTIRGHASARCRPHGPDTPGGTCHRAPGFLRVSPPCRGAIARGAPGCRAASRDDGFGCPWSGPTRQRLLTRRAERRRQGPCPPAGRRRPPPLT